MNEHTVDEDPKPAPADDFEAVVAEDDALAKVFKLLEEAKEHREKAVTEADEQVRRVEARVAKRR